MAPPVGSLVVRVGSDIRGLTVGFKKGSDIVTRFGAVASRAAKRISLLTIAVGVAGVAIGVKLTRDGLKAVDAMTKLGRSLGATQAEMVALNATADLVGIAQEKMQKNVGAFTKRLGEAMDGTGQAVDALKKLGVTARELAAIPLPEALAIVAERTQLLATAAERAAVESDLFSRAGIGMLTTTGDLAGAIRRATKDTEDFGVAVSQIDAAKIESANDAMSRIGLVIKGVSNQIAVRLAPFLEEVANRITEAARASGGFGASIESSIKTGVRLVGALINGFREFQEQLLLTQLTIADLNRKRLIFFGSPEELSAAIRNVEDISLALGELQNRPPFDAEALFGDINEKALATAEAIEAVTSGADVGDPLGRLNGGEAEDPELEALRKKAATRLEIIRQGLLTEREVENEAFEAKLAGLREAEDLQIELEGGFMAAREELEKQHQAELTEIQKREADARGELTAEEWRNRIAATAGFLAQMTSQLASAAGENFKLQKALSIASAVLSGIESVIHSYNFGTRIGGPVLGAAFGAIAAGVQFARIAQISSQQFNRGATGAASVATGGGGGGAAVPTGGGGGGGGAGAQSVNISLVGETFGRTQVRDLIEEINDAVADGARLRVV